MKPLGYAYTFEGLNVDDIWKEVKKNFPENQNVIKICDEFSSNTYDEENKKHKALILAENEKNNDMLIQKNEFFLEEALKASDENVNFFER